MNRDRHRLLPALWTVLTVARPTPIPRPSRVHPASILHPAGAKRIP